MSGLWTRTLLAVLAVGGLIAYGVSGPRSGEVFREQRSLMGTTWSIEVPLNRQTQDAARLATSAAYQELNRLEALMSEWRPESPISLVNAAAGLRAVSVPDELRLLLQRSLEYSRKSQGTFDVTWLGMGHIWHFDDTFRVPTASEVIEARKSIDYRRIHIEGNSISLPVNSRIGLGGIAKGYAIDRAALALKQAGFPDSLVDGGGDILASGTCYGRRWRIGVQDPRAERGQLLGVVELSNSALVSSGDYERFRIVNGTRYHHLIDPRTGWPATAAIASTVLAPTAEQGVALGKAILILGSEEGLRLAQAEGMEALVIDPAQKQHATPGFARVFHPVASALR